jgi:cellulose biosynthesis protein BcsQ
MGFDKETSSFVMPTVISLINLKGGVAKTTTTVQLADFLSAAQKRVLVIDLDPQANATESLLGRNSALKVTPEILDLLGNKKISEKIRTMCTD